MVVVVVLLLAMASAVYFWRRFPGGPAAGGGRSSGGPGMGASPVLASVSAAIGAAVAKVARLRRGQASWTVSPRRPESKKPLTGTRSGGSVPQDFSEMQAISSGLQVAVRGGATDASSLNSPGGNSDLGADHGMGETVLRI